MDGSHETNAVCRMRVVACRVERMEFILAEKRNQKEEKCGAGRTVPSELFSALWLANFECQPRANVSRHGPAKAKVNRQVNT